jgi:DNA-directed RNA polymerase specialized sigma subunit
MNEDWQLEPEYHAPFTAWQQNPNTTTTGAMLTAMKPIISSAVKTYAGSTPSPTMQSRAKLLAVEGLKRYDPTRAKLKTHLMSHMQGLRRFANREDQIMRVPERVGLDNYHLVQAENELQDRLGREASTPELADHTGLSARRIGYIRQASPGLSEGQMMPEGDDENAMGTGPGVVDSPGQSHILNYVYHDLHPTDQLIMEHTMGMNGRRKIGKKQIATKLRLSPGAISQRAARIQQKLDMAHDAWPGGVME